MLAPRATGPTRWSLGRRTAVLRTGSVLAAAVLWPSGMLAISATVILVATVLGQGRAGNSQRKKGRCTKKPIHFRSPQ